MVVELTGTYDEIKGYPLALRLWRHINADKEFYEELINIDPSKPIESGPPQKSATEQDIILVSKKKQSIDEHFQVTTHFPLSSAID